MIYTVDVYCHLGERMSSDWTLGDLLAVDVEDVDDAFVLVATAHRPDAALGVLVVVEQEGHFRARLGKVARGLLPRSVHPNIQRIFLWQQQQKFINCAINEQDEHTYRAQSCTALRRAHSSTTE